MEKNKMTLLISLILLFSITFLLLYSNSQNKIPEVCIKETCFQVELAKTPSQKTVGLMHRSNLNLNQGMLFKYQKSGIHNFWMKNTLIPLDIIWIKDNTIVYIKHNAQPCKDICEHIKTNKEANYVLEINANLSNQLNLNIGDKVTFKNV